MNKSDIKSCLIDYYNISVTNITAAKRGYYGKTYKVETITQKYFVKIDYFQRHQLLYKNSLAIINYFNECNIKFCGEIIKTVDNKLYETINDGVMAVFKWIDGVNIKNDDTKVIEYSLLCETYKVSQMGFNIPTINYSNAQAESFFSKYESLKMNQNSLDDEMIMKLLTEKMSQIKHRANRLSSFSDYCNKSNQKLYITHGDAGGNFMQSSQDNYIIDWDEVMYAPIERDAWVMCNYEWARETFNSELFEVDIVIYSIITT